MCGTGGGTRTGGTRGGTRTGGTGGETRTGGIGGRGGVRGSRYFFRNFASILDSNSRIKCSTSFILVVVGDCHIV